jgi:Uncharacterized membrane protein
MKNGMKYAAVFVGTVIGAGFATGREIALYFKGANAQTAAAAGIMLGLLCGFFMLAGERIGDGGFTAYLFGQRKRIFDIAVFVCAFITFAAMCAGAESIFRKIYGIGWLGLVTALISTLAAILGIKQIKSLNLVLVPIILAFVVLIF